MSGEPVTAEAEKVGMQDMEETGPGLVETRLVRQMLDERQLDQVQQKPKLQGQVQKEDTRQKAKIKKRLKPWLWELEYWTGLRTPSKEAAKTVDNLHSWPSRDYTLNGKHNKLFLAD